VKGADADSCGAEGNYNGYCNPESRGRLRLYLLKPRFNFIEVDHTVPIVDDHVPIEVNPATDERDISGRQATGHNFTWPRSHRHRDRPVKRGGSFTFAQSSATASVVLVCLRSSVISAQRPLPGGADLLGVAEGVKKGFWRFQVGRCEPFAEPVIGRIEKRQHIGLTAGSRRSGARLAARNSHEVPTGGAEVAASPQAYARPLPFGVRMLPRDLIRTFRAWWRAGRAVGSPRKVRTAKWSAAPNSGRALHRARA
jgi:hypothetical protein